MSTRTPSGSNLDVAGLAGDTTKFQLLILAILEEDSRYGLAIKRELEDYYESEVNHGRLYPNLDDLVNKGLVEKSELDKRTNEYALTDDGTDFFNEELAWLLDRAKDQDDDSGGEP